MTLGIQSGRLKVGTRDLCVLSKGAAILNPNPWGWRWNALAADIATRWFRKRRHTPGMRAELGQPFFNGLAVIGFVS